MRNFIIRGDIVLILRTPVIQADGGVGLMAAEHIRLTIFVTGGDQLFQAQMREVRRKIVNKIADLRIITITIHNFAAKMFFLMAQFIFNIGALCIKLIPLCGFCFLKGYVQCHNDRPG